MVNMIQCHIQATASTAICSPTAGYVAVKLYVRTPGHQSSSTC